MVVRRAHHKVKTGCDACKKRRIKCDEGRPTCLHCTKRNLVCNYRPSDTLRRPTALIDVQVFRQRSSSPSAESSDTLDVNEPILKTLNPPHSPKLLQALVSTGALEEFPPDQKAHIQSIVDHFEGVVAATVAVTRDGQIAWLNAIPVLCTQHRFVLYGMLALSSLHLSHISEAGSTEKDAYHVTAVEQMSRGISKFQLALKSVNEENADALFAFSATLAAYTIATTGEAYDELKDTLAAATLQQSAKSLDCLTMPMVRMLRALRGQLVILVPCWYHLQQGILSPLANRDWWPPAVPADPISAEEDRRIQSLDKMWMRPGRAYEYYFDTLRASLGHLRECFALVSQLTHGEIGRHKSIIGDAVLSDYGRFDYGAVLMWSHHISHEFSTLLEQQIPEAWVIAAHWGLLAYRARSAWLSNTWPSALITVAVIVAGKEYHDFLEWPAREVDIDLANMR
ncbi:hypothetical protein BU24DRAFT_427075 [Aaosphaeria arxii CBS 175.79]|uniref:Zn(2)-C6 fungal-type domain-containing protein n=1 Tax=Aaosphaeria arxii CBS 175.79 TaxID=1450172 RepID=A0A6A5XD83_9PLEO|nr:uncharacterized protein BU24DRAFT_427075 [Aaosphaeria arxii CBS 175.79]KAF2010879.1 hypothetical protein BU24DRAFT_427075 [Aaosphaeria arxii CBS 175.79]